MDKKRKTVLIVDDEEDLTWSISRSLERDGKPIRVLCANSGNEALRILQREPITVLVTDLRMPGVDGFELIRHVREHHLPTQIIVMTAYGTEDIEKQVLAANCCYYIEKPFEIASLKTKIYSVLGEQDDLDPSLGGGVDGQIRKLLMLSRHVPHLMVTVYQGKREGRLYCANGRIYHAELGQKRGMDALREILRWPKSMLKAQTGISTPYRTINEKMIM
jgi:CheY-like chemotaxis protein